MAIIDKLNYLVETKTQIKNAIINKGVEVTNEDTFRSYADKINSMEIGGGTDLNVFAQPTEPEIKDGIWINTYKKLTGIPYNFYNGSVVAIGTNIYLFGSINSTYRQYAYKYDTLTDTYTKLTDIPYDFYNGSAVAIGTNIYLFGSGGSPYQKYAYKYDTLTDTYTKLANIPYNFFEGSAVAIGTNIYLFGNGGSAYRQYAYKYDTLINIYTRLTDIPYELRNGASIAIGTNIYLFGNGSQKYTYKYDTLTNTYTKLTDIPYIFYGGSAVAIGTETYLFGSQNNTKRAYKVIFSDYKYTKVELLNNINQNEEHTQMSNILSNKTIFIETKELYKIKLTNILSTYFSKAYISTDTELLEYPIYYGDGEKWNEIN